VIARRLAAALAVALLAAAPARAVEPERVVTEGGIEAWLVHDDANPVISLKLAFRGGAALDPPELPGVAQLAADTLTKGAGELDARAFQDALAAKAIELRFGAGRDSFRGGLKTLRGHRERAFELLGTALTRPRFDDKSVARAKEQQRAAIATRREDPARLAYETLYRTIFPDHPYGRPVDGTRASVARITPEALHAYTERVFTRERLVVGVAGDITPEELKPLLRTAFGGLPASAAEAREVPDTQPANAGETVIVEREARQAWIALAQPGVTRDDPDYFAARVVNQILGGGTFTSRLMKSVRVENGLAYSVYSYLRTLEAAPVLGGGLGTSNDRVARALELTREQWREVAKDGPTQQELADAKTYLTGSVATQLGSTAGIAAVLRAIQREELGIDYVDRRRELIESVTAEEVETMARELLDAEALTTVIVGQPEDVEPTRPAPELAL
jgi:zinc protease